MFEIISIHDVLANLNDYVNKVTVYCLSKHNCTKIGTVPVINITRLNIGPIPKTLSYSWLEPSFSLNLTHLCEKLVVSQLCTHLYGLLDSHWLGSTGATNASACPEAALACCAKALLTDPSQPPLVAVPFLLVSRQP